MRKLRLVVVVFVALMALVGFNLSTSGTAHAQTTSTDGCIHQPTIDTLEACIVHAADQGFITSHLVTRSLLAKLESAENALRHERPSRAIHLLNAFISEVRAQSGNHIVPMHAMHLVMHAQLVLDALKNT